jgi:CHASE3 domain sensor protein
LSEPIQILEQESVESIELDKCIKESKGEIEHTIESIHKVRRITPEIQAIERQLSATFENVKGLQNNDKIIEEILNKIDAAEESIAIRRTSDVADLKGNFANLKQCLVTLRTVVTQHNIQIQIVQIPPQQAVISVIESKEKLQITEPCDEEKKELTKGNEESKTVQKVEEAKEPQNEKLPESPNNITVCLAKTKTEIENVTASFKKVRRPTTELQSAQEKLNEVFEKLESLPEKPEQIEKVIETINKAEVSLTTKNTSDNALVKDNLIKLKEALVLLSHAVKAQKGEIKDILASTQIDDLKIIESSEELKIFE